MSTSSSTRRTVEIRAAALAVALGLAVAPPSWAAAEILPDLPRVAALVVDLTNEFRRGEALPPVATQGKLEESARHFAEYMALTGRYGHDADGSTPARRVEREGYRYCSVSENISYQFDSRGFDTAALARGLVEGWKGSPGHRRNMLAPHVVHTGVAIARGRNGYYYAVQLFARPQSESLAFEVANRAGVPVTYRLGEESFALPRGTVHTHTRCAAERLAVEAGPGLRARGTTLDTRDGDRYTILREGSYLSVRR